MKTRNTIYILACVVIITLASITLCFGNEANLSETETVKEPQAIILEAPVISMDGTTYNAEGPVVLYSGTKKICASSLHFDSEKKGILANNAAITTCNHNPPHYRLETSKFSLSENGWLDARNISVKLGPARILYLPWIKLHFSKQGGQRNFFPLVWYDDESGISLSKSFIVADNDRMQSTIKAKVSQKSSLETLATLKYGIDGNLNQIPGRELSSEYWGPNSLFLLRNTRQLYANKAYESPKQTARLRAYVDYALNQRIDDIDETDIKILKRPEIGIIYTGNPIGWKTSKLDKSLLMSPVLDISWAEMKETPSDYDSLERAKVSLSTAFNILDLGEHSAIQPVFQQTWYKYSSIRDFQIFTYGLDVARIYKSGADVNIRYLSRSSKGLSVFETDDIDVKQELQFATNLFQNGHKYNLGLSYDAKKQHLYEWEIGYGYETECLDIGAYYNNRLKRIGFNLALKNL